MYTFASLALLAASVLAAPMDLEVRQGGTTSNELTSGACRKITFIFARGSTEPGNMGVSVGPPTCSGLKKKFGADAVACQGVGAPYDAGITTNALPGGSTTAAFGKCTDLFTQAASKCPDSILVGGGYSQGAAVMAGGIQRATDPVKTKIVGAILYGYTQNAQTGGSIKNYPKDQVKVFCAKTDGVCGGALLVTAGHLSYSDDVGDAVDFLAQKIQAAGSSTGASASSATGSTGTDASSAGTDSSSTGSSSSLSSLLGGGASSSGASGLSGLGGLSSGDSSLESSIGSLSSGSSATESAEPVESSSASKFGSLFGGHGAK